MKKILYTISGLILAGCSSTSVKLVDEYYLFSPDTYCETYYLKCKMSSENDPEIDSVKSIYWNDSIIIVERLNPQHSWWIIKASGKQPKCCNKDKIYGPYTKKYMDMKVFSSNVSYKKISTE